MAETTYQTLLSLDTSTFTMSLAITRNGDLLTERTLRTRGGHSPHLLNAISEMLRDTSLALQDLDLLVVGKGPGSFTGLRVGLASLKGLAFANQIPLYGVSSLAAMAHAAKAFKGLIVPVLDARKKETYAGLYRSSAQDFLTVYDDAAFTPEKLAAAILEARQNHEPVLLLGEGLKTYGAPLKELLAELGDALTLKTSGHTTPRALDLSELASDITPKDIPELATLEPNYQRLAEAEVKFGKAPRMRG